MKIIQYKRDTKIAVPGIYVGVPMETYHGDLCVGPSISSTGLRTLWDKSPAHYFEDSYLNLRNEDQDDDDDDDDEVKKEKVAFLFGRAAHHLLLGEDAFSTLFIMRPARAPDERAWNGNNNSCKAWLAEQAAAGRTVLTPKQIKTIRRMAKSLAQQGLVQAGILNGLIEHSMVWRDKETGVWLKARPDAIPNDSGDFGDLKTARSINKQDLSKVIGDFGYHQQAALIAEGFETLTGQKMASFSDIFVETKAPCCSRIVTISQADIDRGREQNRHCIRLFAECVATKVWPGPAEDDAEDIELPKWKQEQIDRRLDWIKRAALDKKHADKSSTTEYALTP